MIVEYCHSTQDDGDWPHLMEKCDWADGDLHNSRQVDEADSPATQSHPDWSGTVMEGQNICINDWQQEVKIVNTTARELPTPRHTRVCTFCINDW